MICHANVIETFNMSGTGRFCVFPGLAYLLLDVILRGTYALQARVDLLLNMTFSPAGSV